MGFILLQILKWILLIFLFLLLLLIFILMILLFVPIRYSLKGSILNKEISFQGLATWFFGLIKAKAVFQDEFVLHCKVAGITVYSNQKVHASFYESCNNNFNSDETEHKDAGNGLEDENKKKPEDSLEHKKENMQNDDLSMKKDIEEKDCTRQKDKVKSKKASDEKTKKEPVKEKESIPPLIRKVNEVKEKAEHYYHLLQKEESKITLKRAGKKLLSFFKHLLPVKWKLYGKLGFKEPSLTGQLVAVISLLYPYYGKHLEIIPDYEEEIMDLSVDSKGQIFLGILLYQVLSLLLNRYCFKFIKLWLKESKSSNSDKSKAGGANSYV